MIRIGLIAAAAMLAGGIGVAAAQTSTTPSTPSAANQGKCWDSATKQVRNKTSPMGSTAGSGGSAGTSGSAVGGGSAAGTAGASGYGSSSPTATPGSPGTAGSTTTQVRPPEAAGLPNC